MKLLVTEKKGKTFRILDLDTNETHRAFARDFENVDFIVGTLFECDYTECGGLIESLNVNKETLGDSSKSRIEVCVDDINAGDLVDGVPIISLGKKYAKNGKKMAYAYFK